MANGRKQSKWVLAARSDDIQDERCIVSALETGAAPGQVADLIFAAVTDHRYIDLGHPMDFTNKALEALDIAGWEHAAPVLTSLANGYASASRMEESNVWRNPFDLVAIIETTFEKLSTVVGTTQRQNRNGAQPTELVNTLLGDDPSAIADGLLESLRDDITPADLGGTVAYAAALWIAQFHTSNEFGDWDTALHTFTFANAVHLALRGTHSIELLCGVFDAAMSVYLDRFLNIPAVRLPESGDRTGNPDEILEELPSLLNLQQQVNETGNLVARYLYSGGSAKKLMAMLGRLLLREDRNFHTIQTIEAAFKQYELLEGAPDELPSGVSNGTLYGEPYGVNVLVAAGRYLAALAPTMRVQGLTFQNASRLSRGERLFD